MSCLQAWEWSLSCHMCPSAANQEALGPLRLGLSRAGHMRTGEIARLSMLMLPRDTTAMLGLSRTWGFSFSRQRHPVLQPFNCALREPEIHGDQGWATTSSCPRHQPRRMAAQLPCAEGQRGHHALGKAPERELKGAYGSDFGDGSIPWCATAGCRDTATSSLAAALPYSQHVTPLLGSEAVNSAAKQPHSRSSGG